MVRTFLISVFAFALLSINAQFVFNPDSVEYKYFLGTEEPDPQWKEVGFDDSAWENGLFSIGYGDGDDSTLIPQVPSVYIRMKFEVADKSMYSDANLIVDYDDGFIAYLNENEIARVNLGDSGEFVPYNRLTDRSHEAIFYRFYHQPVPGYYINSEKLNSYLINGTNVIAFQVHNDSVNGSDLSFSNGFFNLLETYYNLYNFYTMYIQQIQLDSTRLPIVSINTNEYGFPNQHVRYPAHMGIVKNTDGSYNKPDDAFTDYDGNISIEIRGESSRDFPKRPYNIETRDTAGNNNNVSLMGMPAENDWILLSPYWDKSLIRNEMTFFFGRKLDLKVPRSRFCEVIINGEYIGLYSFVEKIKRTKNRLDLADLDSNDVAGDDLTGGYIIKFDKGPGGIQFVYPDEENILPVQKNYMTGYVNAFFNVLNLPEFMDPDIGYRHYISTKSLINYIILNEVTKNCDAYKFSTYLYKDRDDKGGKIKFGPLWDYDLAFGNATWQNGNRTYGWQFAESTNNILQIKKMLRDTILKEELVQRWFEVRNNFLSNDSVMIAIDSALDYISYERIRNYEIWPIIDKTLNSQEGMHSGSYNEEIDNLKNWITARLSWIDNNISNIYYPLPVPLEPESLAGLFQYNQNINIYPNPFSDKLTVSILADIQDDYSIELLDMFGKKIRISGSMSLSEGWNDIVLDQDLSQLSNGLYVAVVKKDGIVINKQKLLKQ